MKFFKGFITGLITALILTIGINVFAAISTKINVYLNSFIIKIDGTTKKIDNILYNGNLYLKADDLVKYINYKYKIDKISNNASLNYSFPQLTYNNGTIYRGEVVNGKPNGYGTITTNDGYTYWGCFIDGDIIGKYLMENSDETLTKIDTIVKGKSVGKGYLISNYILYQMQDGEVLPNQPIQAQKPEVSANPPVSPSTNTEYIIKYPLSLYSDEDKRVFLGKLVSSEYDSDGIFNKYGNYGSKYSRTSIWNEYGDYGGKYSSKSAFNKFAMNPPLIIDSDGTIVGKLTINTSITGAVNPNDILAILKNLGQ